MNKIKTAVAIIALSAVLAGCSSNRPRGPSTDVINHVLTNAPGEAQPSDIVAVEVAYGQDAKERGQFVAGEAFAAPGALMHVRSGPIAFAAIAPALKQSGISTQWEPRVVVMSCDGALAVSQGRYADQDGVVGNYVTVWQRQSDLEYKWSYDVAGPDVPQPPPRREFADGDIVVTAIDSIKGLVATCPRGGVPIPPPPAIPIGEEGAGEASLSKDGTLRWRWEHQTDGTKFVSVDYFYEGDWVNAIEESLAPHSQGE